ncbi:GNAT family N-acetyltransferase [uncultured Adlercreutzia sp.]|uniref:GNAT family N-acetyltransferase n=1 Tax=uncultured Adlercreutzia sp. TaxID=875803 RepID=UPI0025DB26C8|nr:GNAT family N-acetyltransferase [uncultured Adlercreutzia sp.]
MIDMRIDQGTTGDIDALLALYAAVQESVAGTDNDPLWKVGVHPCREQLEAAVAAAALFVLRAEGQLAGALIADETAAPGYEAVPWRVDAGPGEFAVVHLFAIRPDFRGQGLARPFLTAVEDELRRRGRKAVRLDTLVTNVGAQRTYERLGYANMGRHHLTYGTYIDTEDPRFVLFEKSLL